MKLLGSTKSKITKDKNGKNMPYLGIKEVVLTPCNVVNNIINKIQESCVNLFLINRSARYQIFHLKLYIFKNV